MSVKVNLLPREIEERRIARRITGVSVLGCVLVVAVLGLFYVMKLNEVAEAEEEREQVRAEVAQLEAQIAELEQYRVLAEQLEARNALLASAMAEEVSMARVLNDLALAFPSSASLRTMTATMQEPTAPAGAADESVVSLSFDGYSTERFAPGVETVLVEFDKVSTFFRTFLTTAQEEEIGETDVTGFNGSLQLHEEARTGRYTDGLPEGVPQ
jgi:Tfp pilus assembly protein PilO